MTRPLTKTSGVFDGGGGGGLTASSKRFWLSARAADGLASPRRTRFSACSREPGRAHRGGGRKHDRFRRGLAEGAGFGPFGRGSLLRGDDLAPDPCANRERLVVGREPPRER